MTLTAPTLRCLAAILQLAQERRPITARGLGRRLRCTHSGIWQHGGPVEKLVAAGLITIQRGKAATIRPACRMVLMQGAMG